MIFCPSGQVQTPGLSGSNRWKASKMANVVIGKSLADARAYSEKYGLDAQIVSPQSFHARYNGLQVDRFYVTKAAFEHPGIIRTVLTVQTFMRKRQEAPA